MLGFIARGKKCAPLFMTEGGLLDRVSCTTSHKYANIFPKYLTTNLKSSLLLCQGHGELFQEKTPDQG
jgi:hypothetical protein